MPGDIVSSLECVSIGISVYMLGNGEQVILIYKLCN